MHTFGETKNNEISKGYIIVFHSHGQTTPQQAFGHGKVKIFWRMQP